MVVFAWELCPFVFLPLLVSVLLHFYFARMPRWPDKTPALECSSEMRVDIPDAPPLGPPSKSGLTPSTTPNPLLTMHIFERLAVLCEHSAVAHRELARAMEQRHVPGERLTVPVFRCFSDVKCVADLWLELGTYRVASACA